MKPSHISKDQFIKVVVAAIYVCASALVSFFISQIADTPELFGPLTPVINVCLVALKQLFTEQEG